MTCIIGLIDRGTVYMGGDSAGSNGWNMMTMANPKVFVNKEMIIGYTGSFRMGQLLQYSLRLPEQKESSDMEYLVGAFTNCVRDLYRNSGLLVKVNEKEEGGTFLVGYKGNLYRIESDFSIIQVAHNYTACGSGQDFALGAMYATSDMQDPVRRIEIALNSASEFSCSVRGPYTILSLPNNL